MIIQCDHCSAKFKMDDSKLAKGPVKVRCAKCKEVFVVSKDESVEEKTAVAAPEPTPAEPAGSSTPAPESAAPSPSIDIAGFSFDQEPPAEGEAPPVDQPGESNEFDWQSSSVSFDAAPAKAEFDLSAFESSIAASESSDSVHSEIPESGEFNFDDMGGQEPPATSPEPEGAATHAPQDDFSLDFGEVSFGESQQSPQESPTKFSGSEDSDFTLPSEFSSPVPGTSSSDDFVISFNSDTPAQDSGQTARTDSAEGVNFGEFSFGEMEPSPAAPASKMKADEPMHVKDVPAAPASGFMTEALDDELPPSALSSRKKSGSQFPLMVIIGAIFLVISLAGVGVYFFSGPKAFSSVGLGFLVNWYGDRGAEEGNISLKNVSAGYITNSSVGELFVVRGEAVNNYKKPRASIQVKISIVGKAGEILASKSAYTGNSLSAEQLQTLPMPKMEEVMNNQFGDSLANLGLKPGSSIPFVVVIGPVPKDATDYTVQVSGSTVATQ